MDVSIILLTKNAGEKFPALLKCIFSQKTELTYEVLVIDSGSTDDTLTVAQRFPAKITRIKPEEFHHGKTRNLGAGLAAGRILVYLTQDALPLNDNWLQNLTEDLKYPEVAMVIGRQIPWQYIKPPEKFFYAYYFPDFGLVISNGRESTSPQSMSENVKKGHSLALPNLESKGWPYKRSSFRTYYPRKQKKNKFSTGYRDNVFISNVNSAIRRDVWQQFKFSENIIMTEDKEFANRVLAAGLQIVYQPEAAVYHAHDFGIRSIFRRSVDYGISLRQGTVKQSGSPRPAVFKFIGYLYTETKYLIDSSYLKWIPYAIMYEVSRYWGTLLGKIGLAKQHKEA